MKVRSFILVTLVPIFFGLAVANAAALWFAKSRELTTDLEEQARSAAVSVAEYLSARPELAQRLSTGSGRAALTLSMAQIEGLKGIYLLDAQGRCCLLRSGRKPERLPKRPAVAMTPQLGAIAALSTGEHGLTAAVRLHNGQVLGVDLDADRFLAAREALRDRVIAMLVAGLLAGIAVAVLVAGWLVGDLRRLQRLLAVGVQPAADLASRFMETQDTAEAILLLHDNLRNGSALRKRRLLADKEARDRVAAVRSLADQHVGDRVVELHGIELAIGSIGQIEPGETVATIVRESFAACVLVRVRETNVARAFATAALVRTQFERNENIETFAGDLELASGLFDVDLLALAWSPGEAAAIFIEASDGTCHCRSVDLAASAARLFHFGGEDSPGSERLDRLGWTSAAQRLCAARNLSETRGWAFCLMPAAAHAALLAA